MNEDEDPQVNETVPQPDGAQSIPTRANTSFTTPTTRNDSVQNVPMRENSAYNTPAQANDVHNAPTQPFDANGPATVGTMNAPVSSAPTGMPSTQARQPRQPLLSQQPTQPFQQPRLAGGYRRRPWLWLLLGLIILLIIIALIWSNTHSGPNSGVFVQGNVPANGGPAVKTFQVGDHPLVVIQGHGSDISVHTGNAGGVVVSAHKHNSNYAPDPNDTRIVYNQGDDGHGHDRINIGTEPLGKDVDYDLTVPPATLIQIQIDSGSVSADGISGITVDTNSGGLDLANIQGPVNVHTESGDITGRNIKGQAIVNAGSGSIRLNNISGPLQAVTRSGDVIVRQSALSGQSKMKTSSGSVRYDGSLDPKGSYDLSTNSGDIDLTLPGNAALQINASTGSGNVNNEFGSSTVGSAPRAQITATIGSGSVTVNKS